MITGEWAGITFANDEVLDHAKEYHRLNLCSSKAIDDVPFGESLGNNHYTDMSESNGVVTTVTWPLLQRMGNNIQRAVQRDWGRRREPN
jgi:hypothetical protein